MRAARSGSTTASDISREGHECDEAHQHAERTHVGPDPEARGAAPESTDDDGCRRKRAENAPDDARDRFGRAGDQQADRAAERGADDRRRPDTEDVRPEDPGDRDRQPEPEPEAEPDRVPATHAEAV